MLRLALLGVLLLSTWPLGAADAPEWAVAVFPSGAEFSLEIAATDRQRQLGYMFREDVPPHEGMLFLFDATEHHGIWMKNCRVPLDIIWLDAEFRVVQIAAQAQPCPEDGPCSSMLPMQASRYVLEVAGGRAAEEKLVQGDLVIIHSEPSL
jgi:uncharacterized membrane protein (UPF0127 family)